MPPPKKAAKKVAKKVAKKAAKHADPKHKEAKDLRRAYEHLGRIESLQRAGFATAETDVATLVSLAQQQLKDGHANNAADLLRAAEHLSFASLAAEHTKQTKVSGLVKDVLEEEYHHLTDKAAEHWGSTKQRHTAVASLYKRSLQSSEQALKRGAYREALELVRAAESLAHVEKRGPEKLTAAQESIRLYLD
jgi:hypothetical protein